MSNSHLKDRSISLKAKGLLSLILSLPDGWVYTIKGLATLSSDGLDSTRAALKTLKITATLLGGSFMTREVDLQNVSTQFMSVRSGLLHQRVHRYRKADNGQSVTVECVNGKAHAIKYE